MPAASMTQLASSVMWAGLLRQMQAGKISCGMKSIVVLDDKQKLSYTRVESRKVIVSAAGPRDGA